MNIFINVDGHFFIQTVQNEFEKKLMFTKCIQSFVKQNQIYNCKWPLKKVRSP